MKDLAAFHVKLMQTHPRWAAVGGSQSLFFVADSLWSEGFVDLRYIAFYRESLSQSVGDPLTFTTASPLSH